MKRYLSVRKAGRCMEIRRKAEGTYMKLYESMRKDVYLHKQEEELEELGLS